MIKKELEKLNMKVQFKMKNNLDYSKEMAEILELSEKEGLFNDYDPEETYKAETSVSFIGPEEDKIKFFKERLALAYKKIDKVYEKNNEENLDDLFLAISDLGEIYFEITNGEIGEETDEPFFEEHEAINKMELEYIFTHESNPEYAPLIFEHIYKYVPWLIEKIENGTAPQLMTSILYLYGAVINCYIMHTVGIFNIMD